MDELFALGHVYAERISSNQSLNFKAPKQTRSVAATAASIDRIDFGERLTLVNACFGERLLRRRRTRLPRRFGCRAPWLRHLDGVANLQCLGWAIDHLVLRR